MSLAYFQKLDKKIIYIIINEEIGISDSSLRVDSVMIKFYWNKSQRQVLYDVTPFYGTSCNFFLLLSYLSKLIKLYPRP